MNATSDVLTLSLEPLDGDRLPVRLVFRNRGKTPVRLLNLFDEETLPAILTVDVVDPKGNPVGPMFGGGKVDPFLGGMRYIDIEAGSSWNLTVRVAALDPSVLELPEGSYAIQAVYQNVHGDACFIGTLSASTEIRLPPDAAAKR